MQGALQSALQQIEGLRVRAETADRARDEAAAREEAAEEAHRSQLDAARKELASSKEKARQLLVEREQEMKRLQAQLRAAQGRDGSAKGSADGSAKGSADGSADGSAKGSADGSAKGSADDTDDGGRLRQRVAELEEALEQTIAEGRRAQGENVELKRAVARADAGDVATGYLKDVLFKYLCASEERQRDVIFPLLAKAVQFTPPELRTSSTSRSTSGRPPPPRASSRPSSSPPPPRSRTAPLPTPPR